jgi:hypothetical protein
VIFEGRAGGAQVLDLNLVLDRRFWI